MAVEAKNCFGRRSDTIRVTPKAPALGVTAFGIEFRNLRSPRSIPPDRISLLPERKHARFRNTVLDLPASQSIEIFAFLPHSLFFLSCYYLHLLVVPPRIDSVSSFPRRYVALANRPNCPVLSRRPLEPHPSRSQPGTICSFTTSSLRQSRPEPLQQNWIGCTARTLVSPSSLHNFESRFHIH